MVAPILGWSSARNEAPPPLHRTMATSRKKTSPRAVSAVRAQATRAASRRGRSAQIPPAELDDSQPHSSRSVGPVNPDSMPPDVIEFITAVDDYKRKHARPFPSWSEVLEVLKGLGYRKAG